jgi:hypothetical protein
MLIRRLLGRDVKIPKLQARAANLEFFHFNSGRVKAIKGVEAVRAEGPGFSH